MKNLIFKKFINTRYFNLNKNKKINKNYLLNLKKIIKSKDFSNNIFFSFIKNFSFSFNLKEIKKYRKFKHIAIIGMGGSILGAEAIYCCLRKKIKKKITFIDDINKDKIDDLNLNKNKNKILFIIISKSGNTIETLGNLLSLKFIKKNEKNFIIISERSNNYLYKVT